MPVAFTPIQSLYTRQQIHEATGLSLDVLGYWIKDGLLRAREAEGEGRGKHRQFGFEALHIAALLAEIHGYGVGLAGLRRVAALLWRSVDVTAPFPGITEEAVLDCWELIRLRKSYPPKASLADGDTETISFEEWLEAKQKTASALDDMAFQLEPKMSRELYRLLALHFDLFSERSFASPHTRLYVISLENDDIDLLPTDILESDRIEQLTSYLNINASRIIRDIWGLDEASLHKMSMVLPSAPKDDENSMAGRMRTHSAGPTTAAKGDDRDGEPLG